MVIFLGFSLQRAESFIGHCKLALCFWVCGMKREMGKGSDKPSKMNRTS